MAITQIQKGPASEFDCSTEHPSLRCHRWCNEDPLIYQQPENPIKGSFRHGPGITVSRAGEEFMNISISHDALNPSMSKEELDEWRLDLNESIRGGFDDGQVQLWSDGVSVELKEGECGYWAWYIKIQWFWSVASVVFMMQL